jgi:hypothetical protein
MKNDRGREMALIGLAILVVVVQGGLLLFMAAGALRP